VKVIKCEVSSTTTTAPRATDVVVTLTLAPNDSSPAAGYLLHDDVHDAIANWLNEHVE
jgi:hypothetical protein